MKPLYLLGGLAAAGLGIFLYEKKANAATIAQTSGSPPLSLPAAANATAAVIPNANPAPIPNPGAAQVPDFLPATLVAAATLDVDLLQNGCTTQSDPNVQAFQNAYQADAKGGSLFGGADGKYGTSTQTALSQVLGAPAPTSCFSN